MLAMEAYETRRRSAGLGCRATTFGALLAAIPSVTSDGTDFLVCGAGVFFGFATEREVGFLGMTDVYLTTSNNSQSLHRKWKRFKKQCLKFSLP